MSDDLLPCPFCGGEAEWKSGGPGCAWISCKSCPAETGDGSIDRIKAAWNRRAALPARGVKELVEALTRQADNMAFVLNRVFLPGNWRKKFDKELTEDRAILAKLEGGE